MSRTFVVATLAAACLIGFGARQAAHAEPAVKSSKSDASERQKGGGQGQSVKTTADRSDRSSTGDRTDSEYSQSKSR
jgi:hypothetical protein